MIAMSLKEDGQLWSILEQIIEDPVSGLTLQFEVTPHGEPHLRIFGDLPYGNREIVFDTEGKEVGAGTSLAGLCKPAWLTKIDD